MLDAVLKSASERVKEFNDIVGERGMTSVKMLAWLEKTLTENVYIASLNNRLREGETMIVAEAATAEPLTVLLLRLEKESRFERVLLSKQGTRKTPTSTVVQFEIRVKERL